MALKLAGLFDNSGPDILSSWDASLIPDCQFDVTVNPVLQGVLLGAFPVGEFDGDVEPFYNAVSFAREIQLKNWFDATLPSLVFQQSVRVGESDPSLYVPSAFMQEIDVLAWWDPGLPTALQTV